jgi:hypothetical protein
METILGQRVEGKVKEKEEGLTGCWIVGELEAHHKPRRKELDE